MSALEEDSNAASAAAPAVAVEASDSNAAPPPLPPAANNAAGDNNNIQQDDTITTAPMIDLSPYFNTLIDSLHRNNDSLANSAPAAAAANGSNNNSNAPQLRSMMVSLLWNGVELIANAGRATFGQQQQNQQQGTQFVVDTVGGDNNDTTTAASSSTSSIFPPKFAAVYLYAVAQNIVALEEIVLQQERLTTADGTVMDVLDGGVSVKQVAEIISVSFKILCLGLLSLSYFYSTANVFTHTLFQQHQNKRLQALLQSFVIPETLFQRVVFCPHFPISSRAPDLIVELAVFMHLHHSIPNLCKSVFWLDNIAMLNHFYNLIPCTI